MLKGKTVVVGVCGGIAAYKTCEVVSRLRKLGADVHVIMTKHAAEFVRPLTFETLSNNPCVSDMFRRETEWEVEHISLAKKADLFVVAPATANFVGKYANGIADDMLTTTVMATRAPVLIAPSMNEGMLTSRGFERNLATLRQWGVFVADGESGFLACGDIGKGRMAEPQAIADAVCKLLCEKEILRASAYSSLQARLSKNWIRSDLSPIFRRAKWDASLRAQRRAEARRSRLFLQGTLPKCRKILQR